jgi:hypothetical protein
MSMCECGSVVYDMFPPAPPVQEERKQDKYGSYSKYINGHMLEFVPGCQIPGNYRGSIKGMAFLNENRGLIKSDESEFMKRVAVEHECVHLDGIKDELQTRAETFKRLITKGKFIEAYIAKEQFEAWKHQMYYF